MKTRHLASFRDLLRTGTLGLVTPDMCLFDIARTLGVPTYFYTDSVATVPAYWCYKNLELQFDIDPPYKIDFFQIENAGYLEGEYEVFTENLIMTLDGFDGDTNPSQFLAADLWDLDVVSLQIGALADDIYLGISAGRIAMAIDVDSRFIKDEDAVRYVESTDLAQIVSDIDGRTSLNSIFAFSDPTTASAVPGLRHQLSGREYLDLLDRRTITTPP